MAGLTNVLCLVGDCLTVFCDNVILCWDALIMVWYDHSMTIVLCIKRPLSIYAFAENCASYSVGILADLGMKRFSVEAFW